MVLGPIAKQIGLQSDAAMARLTLFGLLAVPWLFLLSLVAADATLDLQNKGRPNIDARLAKSTTCTKDKLKVRREW